MSDKERFYSQERKNKWLLDGIQNYDPGLPEKAWINTSLPYSDINFEWLEDDSIYYEAFNSLPLHRLSSIKQLSFLTFRYFSESDAYAELHFPFNHDRFDHSIVVAMVSERILKRNGFDDQEINKGIIAGLLHDIATPALGDATKNIDPHNLHEEDFWQEAIGENGHRLLNNHEIGLEEMSDIIKNKGTYGIILDIADRITYVMKDLRQVALHPDISLHDDIDDELSEIARKNQDIGNIYRDVLFDESTHQVYFNDPDRLFRFLNLRGLLHFNLYQSPYAAGRDRLFSRLIEPLYTPTDPTIEKPLSPQTLRKMTDSELMEFLCERYGKSSPVYEFFSNEMVSWIPKFEQFTSVQEAEKKEKELQYDSNIVTLGVVSMRGFNTGTDYFVRSDDGSIIPFREAEPSSTAILQEMSKATKGVYLYYTSLSEESPFNSLLKEVFHSK